MTNTHEQQPAVEKPAKRKKVFSVMPRISMPSVQGAVLILLIIVGVLQTVQLFGLKQAVAQSSTTPTVETSTTNTGGSGSSQLPSMVGGC